MAGFITYDISKPDCTWSSANWVYTSFLDHVIELFSDDADVVHRLTSSKYNQSMSLSRLMEEDSELYGRILDAFKCVCEQVANKNCLASVNGKVLEEESQNQFRESIEGLSALIYAKTPPA